MHRLIGTLAMALSLTAVPALASDVSYDQRNPVQTQAEGSSHGVTLAPNDASKEQDQGGGAGEMICHCPRTPSSTGSSPRSEEQREFLESIWTSA